MLGKPAVEILHECLRAGGAQLIIVVSDIDLWREFSLSASCTVNVKVVVNRVNKFGYISAQNRQLVALTATRNVGVRKKSNAAAVVALDCANLKQFVQYGSGWYVAAVTPHQFSKAQIASFLRKSTRMRTS